MYEICFSKLEKEKRPRVFEEGGSFDKSQACSLPQSTSKKVSGVCQVSLYASSLILYLSHGAPPTLGSIRNTSPLHPDLFPLVFWRKVERGGAAVEGRVEGEGGGVISSVYGVVSQRHPVAPTAPALPPLTSGWCSRVRESRSGGGELCCRRGLRLALPVSCVQQSGSRPPAPSFAPPL